MKIVFQNFIPLLPRCLAVDWLTWKDPVWRLASQQAPQLQGCVSDQGFSLHADTQCGPQQRQKLERLCRYITRPALGHKRLHRTSTGAVVLQLKTPYRDGTTHLVMTPLEFLQRLAPSSRVPGSISFASMACSRQCHVAVSDRAR